MWADIQIGATLIRIINCHLQTTNFNGKRRSLNDLSLQNTNIQQTVGILTDITQELTKNFKIRATQANIIRQVIDTTQIPIILCGDFNDTPFSYTYHTIKGDMDDSFKTQGNGYAYTFRGIYHLLRMTSSFILKV